jgi:aspartyl-tRNA(Asn)/glutamyl-tRNA(Gln) amidotransferase subunit A
MLTAYDQPRSCTARTEAALAAAGRTDGQGGAIFTRLYRQAALAAAAAADVRAASGAPLSAIDGLLVSIKDLFDVAGEATEAGAPALSRESPALTDAAVVARLRAAGAVIVGKTNMTQFALSGLGLNPQRGTPLSPWRRAEAHIAGGSSSGAAASVADAMVAAAIGTDTGGSVRIPAAFCGLVGFKPTASRVSRRGVFALSPSLDSIGPICTTVKACAAIDAVIADPEPEHGSPSLADDVIRIATPLHYVLEDLDPAVAAAFTAALERLERVGAQRVDLAGPWLERLPELSAAGGFSPIEGWAEHREVFERVHGACDQRVMARFLAARAARAADYIDMLKLRGSLMDLAGAAFSPFAAVAFPTVAMVPPRLAELDGDAAYDLANRRVIRNAAVANLLDVCAITLPCHQPGEAPVGFTLMGPRNGDKALLDLAMRLEPVITLG